MKALYGSTARKASLYRYKDKEFCSKFWCKLCLTISFSFFFTFFFLYYILLLFSIMFAYCLLWKWMDIYNGCLSVYIMSPYLVTHCCAIFRTKCHFRRLWFMFYNVFWISTFIFLPFSSSVVWLMAIYHNEHYFGSYSHFQIKKITIVGKNAWDPKSIKQLSKIELAQTEGKFWCFPPTNTNYSNIIY